MTRQQTQEIVEGYTRSWAAKDVEAARSYLADDLDFVGAIDRFTSADDFKQALQGFCSMLVEHRPLAALYGDGEAFLLYDCVTASPAGTIRCAEYFELSGGKIQQIRLVFDATELRKLMAA